jgi:hypothetical protein
MKFSLIAVALAAMATAAPTAKRAVFTDKTFAELSISGGTAGNAEAEALEKLGGLPTDLTTVEQADLDFLDSVNGLANDAEKEAFNTAIEAASGEEADALQVSVAPARAMCTELSETDWCSSHSVARSRTRFSSSRPP